MLETFHLMEYKMDRVEAILINAFQYERTQVVKPSNSKAPTWWPHIVREFDPKKWATSPDPDSYPVDGVWELPKLGDKEIYDWVEDTIFDKLLTGNEKKILFIFLGSGYRIPLKLASNKLGLRPVDALEQYEHVLLKIKNSLQPHQIHIYFQKIV